MTFTPYNNKFEKVEIKIILLQLYSHNVGLFCSALVVECSTDF